jgi:beta-lactamase class A
MSLLREKLQRDLGKEIEVFPGVMGISIRDLNGGEDLLFNAKEEFPIASSIKIVILLEFHRQVEEGDINPEKILVYPADYKTWGSGVLKNLTTEALSMPIKDYATLMITVSDNAATNLMIDLLGMEQINSTLKEIGLTKTRLKRKMMDTGAIREGKDNISTPREMMILLDAIYQGDGMSEYVREETLRVLKYSKEGIVEGVIRNAVPPQIELANKSGWVSGATCDVGIVFQPNRPYIVGVLTKHLPHDDLHMFNNLNHMTLITRLIQRYFQELSLSTPQGRHL